MKIAPLAHLKTWIESHGFQAFINSDNSISYWFTDSTGLEHLQTIKTVKQAYISLGY